MSRFKRLLFYGRYYTYITVIMSKTDQDYVKIRVLVCYTDLKLFFCML